MFGQVVVKRVSGLEASWSGAADPFAVAAAGATIIGTSGDNTLTGTSGDDYIDAGDGNDTVAALGGNDTVYAGGGADRVRGGEGADQLWGDAGNDVLIGEAGNDYLVGGPGNDTYYIDDPGDLTVEGGDDGIDTVRTSADFYTLGYNVENGIVRSSAGLHLAGNKLDNWLVGGRGGDTLSGLAGNDRLVGGAGSDTLNGGDGADRLDGGAGLDQFYGGAGADSFLFRDGDFAGRTAAACDVIHDFSHAAGDRIRLDPVDADALHSGNQAFAFIGTAGFHHVAGELRFEQIGGSTYLSGDVDADGLADFMIRVDGLHTFVAGDFIL